MASPRPYASLLAKGEDRRQRILSVAQRLLTTNGWRSTTLAQIAGEAGVTPAGLLHHFPSKERLLHALLDVRDAQDAVDADFDGDLVEEIRKVAGRMERSPELVGTFVVLLVENLMPDAPLHDRLFDRWRTSVDFVARVIRRGQRAGKYRDDVDPQLRATEIVAFLNGVEISWLLDRSIPLVDVFNGYTESLARDLAAKEK